MKKIILAAAVLLGCISIQKAEAQVSVSLGVNIGSQPAWGPVGYDYANYYYMPDIDTYYDVPTHQYVYYDNNVWVHRAYLPARYRNYNVYGGYKVVINERNPWVRNNIYRTRYAGYRGRHDQVIIRNSRDVRYANYWRGGHSYGNPRYANHSRGNYRPGNRYGNRDQHFAGRGNPGRGNEGHGNPGRGNQGHGNPGRGNQGHGGEHHGGGHDRH